MGRPDLKDDPRFLTRTARVQNIEAVDELIEGWTKDLSRNEVARCMAMVKVPCAPVRELSEVTVDENMHARGSLQWIDHPELGRVVLPHSPLVFEGAKRPADRAELAARRQQRASFRRVAWPLTGRARGIQGGRRHLVSRHELVS